MSEDIFDLERGGKRKDALGRDVGTVVSEYAQKAEHLSSKVC